MKTAQEYLNRAFDAYGNGAEIHRTLQQAQSQTVAGGQQRQVKFPTPKNRRQIWKFERNLRNALAAAKNEAEKKEIRQYLKMVAAWQKREFVGNIWLLLVSLLIFAYYVYATIHNAESYTSFEAEVMAIIDKNPWLMVFNISYVFSFLLYFWAFRAPRWLSRTKGLNGNSSFNPASMFNYQPVEIPTTFTTIYDGSGKVIGGSASLGGTIPPTFIMETVVSFLLLLALFAFLWMLLPVITLYGILRFRVLCV